MNLVNKEWADQETTHPDVQITQTGSWNPWGCSLWQMPTRCWGDLWWEALRGGKDASVIWAELGGMVTSGPHRCSQGTTPRYNKKNSGEENTKEESNWKDIGSFQKEMIKAQRSVRINMQRLRHMWLKELRQNPGPGCPCKEWEGKPKGEAQVVLSPTVSIRTAVPSTRVRAEAQTWFVEGCGFSTNLGHLLMHISENNNSNSSNYSSHHSSFCMYLIYCCALVISLCAQFRLDIWESCSWWSS